MPIVVSIVFSVFLLAWRPVIKTNVLSYATELSRGGLLEATNNKRNENGRGALQLSDKLNKAAQAKANDMAVKNYWSHNTPEGKSPWVFIDKTGYNYSKAGENLAYGFSSSDSTISGWMNSNSHRENLLDNNYQEVGFGYANAPDFQNDGPETVVVALYATPISGTSAKQQTKNNNLVASASIVEPPSKTVSILGVATGNETSWAVFGVGLVSGGALVAILIRHGLRFRRLIREGEYFILHHPLIDAGLILLASVSAFLTQGAGIIR